MDVTFNVDTAFQSLLHAGSFDAQTLEAAELVADAARGIAPVLTGAYRDSITASVVSHGRARVTAADPKAYWIEYGNRGGRQAPQFVLRRALTMVRR